MMSKVFALTLAMFGSAAAYCPNGCSGHGTCSNGVGMKDKCSCFTHLDGDDVHLWGLSTTAAGGGTVESAPESAASTQVQ